ncbi:hypothetical protein [Methylobacterium terrae]|uniref:hypothetical protein n=1 Tax=Methylobacterium terrae TaxID=2202827 RepID=UPI0013A532E5|nr:hypothetical protein [Methylobacterium terrae]
MSGEKILRGLREAVTVARGEAEPARVRIIKTTTFPWLCEVNGRPVVPGAWACLCRGCQGALLEFENARLRRGLEAADYLINRLSACHAGKVVRDLGEATAAYEVFRPRPAPVPTAGEEG